MKEAVVSELDPPRLLSGGSALERRLLESAQWDAAPPGARERMATALGPALVDPPAPASAGPRVQDRWLQEKWLHAVPTPRAALLGLTGAGIATYLLASLLSQPAASPYEAPAGAPLAPLADEQPLAAGKPLPEQPLPEQPLPGQHWAAATPPAAATSPDLAEGAPVLQDSAPQRSHRAPSVTSESTPRRSPARHAQKPGTLLEEVRLLDATRSALRAGDLPTAAHALRRYDQRFPRGELQNEQSVLAVELLLARGEGALARERARQLLQQPGMQRYAPHLRAILQGGSEPARAGGSDTGAAHIRARR